LMKIKIL